MQLIRTALNDAVTNCDFLLEGRNQVTTPPIGTEIKLYSDHYSNCHERFQPGDHVKLYALSYDPTKNVTTSAPLAVALEASGEYYFWPSWTHDFDSSIINLVPEQPTSIEILNFQWPDTGTATESGLKFYSALLSDDQSSVRGHFDMVAFEFGP